LLPAIAFLSIPSIGMEVQDSYKELIIAIAHKKREEIKAIVSNVALLKSIDFGKTYDIIQGSKADSILSLAVKIGDVENTRILLENANISADQPILFGGISPLHLAVENQDKEMTELLLKHGADVNLATIEGDTPLLIAVQKGSMPVFDLLLDFGADVNLAPPQQVTPLTCAVYKKNEEIFCRLVANGATIDPILTEGVTPLHMAAQQGYLHFVKLLLEKGANVNLDSPGYGSPLCTAIKNKHQEVIQFLLEKGAKAPQMLLVFKVTENKELN